MPTKSAPAPNQKQTKNRYYIPELNRSIDAETYAEAVAKAKQTNKPAIKEEK